MPQLTNANTKEVMMRPMAYSFGKLAFLACVGFLLNCGDPEDSESGNEDVGRLTQGLLDVCSMSADNHLLGSNHHRLSWQTIANCGKNVTFMKVTYTVQKDGGTWYGGSTKQNGTGNFGASDTPYCLPGTHSYKVIGTLNYYYFNVGHTLTSTSSSIKCTGS